MCVCFPPISVIARPSHFFFLSLHAFSYSGPLSLSLLTTWLLLCYVADLHAGLSQMAWLFLLSILLLKAAAKIYSLSLGLLFKL